LEGVASSKVEMRACLGDVDHSSRHCVASAFAPAAIVAAQLTGKELSKSLILLASGEEAP
jgi:hypothetical protein